MEYSQKKEDQKIEETFYDKEVEINPRERKIRTYGKLKYGTLCSISWCYCLHKKIDKGSMRVCYKLNNIRWSWLNYKLWTEEAGDIGEQALEGIWLCTHNFLVSNFSSIQNE